MSSLRSPTFALLLTWVAVCLCSRQVSAFGLLRGGIKRLGFPIQSPHALHPRQGRVNLDSSATSATDKEHRFDRTASQETQTDQPILFEIDNVQYNLTAWARAHPGGERILKKFHDKDASKAFHAAGHSSEAYEMLKDFAVPTSGAPANATMADVIAIPASTSDNTQQPNAVPRWRKKLFSGEDPMNIHKSLGIFCLLNFIYRYGHIYFGDPSAGFGTRRGQGIAIWAALSLVPHAMLSLSSLLFHTVPRERVIGRPMIWQEFRVHNIIFSFRSILVALFGWMSYTVGNKGVIHKSLVCASCAVCLATHLLVDETTRRFSDDKKESLVATHPFWEGCSDQTQRRFKNFYAVSQLQATLTCLWFGNPAWAFAVLPPFQILSLLMTLVRKGLCSTQMLHIVYAASLAMPYFMAFHDIKTAIAIVGMGVTTYKLRRRGVSKYALWIPLIIARCTIGDRFMTYGKF